MYIRTCSKNHRSPSTISSCHYLFRQEQLQRTRSNLRRCLRRLQLPEIQAQREAKVGNLTPHACGIGRSGHLLELSTDSGSYVWHNHEYLRVVKVFCVFQNFWVWLFVDLFQLFELMRYSSTIPLYPKIYLKQPHSSGSV